MGDLDLSDLAGVEDFESLSADDTAGLVERLMVGVVEDDSSDNGGGIAAPDTRKTKQNLYSDTILHRNQSLERQNNLN